MLHYFDIGHTQGKRYKKYFKERIYKCCNDDCNAYSNNCTMKHQKEWHTCDRCGVEIEYNYSAIVDIEVEKQSYSLGICGAIYKRKTQRERNGFELCPNCRRDFERFMRNE